jgi:hypothetical protein
VAVGSSLGRPLTLGRSLPRGRWLKPEFFRDRKMADLGPVAALVYQALWVFSDDGGMARCDPDLLKGEVFYRWGAVGVPEISEALSRLAALGRVKFFQGGDEHFCQILSWERHQKVHKPSNFRYCEQYKDFREVVPEWCDTSEALVRESPPPRLPDSQTPRRPESQPDGGATRRAGTNEHTDNGPTISDLMDLVRKRLYVPDGKPPADWNERREVSTLKQLLKRHSARDVALAIEGVALVRDFPGVYVDVVDWRDQDDGRATLHPGAKATLRVLHGSRSGVLPMFTIATNAYWKRADSRPAPPDADLSRDEAVDMNASEASARAVRSNKAPNPTTTKPPLDPETQRLMEHHRRRRAEADSGGNRDA